MVTQLTLLESCNLKNRWFFTLLSSLAGLQLPSEVLGVRNSVFWMPGWPGWDDMVVGLEKSRPKVLAGARANPPSKV